MLFLPSDCCHDVVGLQCPSGLVVLDRSRPERTDHTIANLAWKSLKAARPLIHGRISIAPATTVTEKRYALPQCLLLLLLLVLARRAFPSV